ncbi:hypothetical protein [Streptomyces sp. NPDC056987]|uniref:hypothetical protein n=1 Tax=Streptomyces sp. NPDC056987 TaxID=3345988 RepID=UPI00362F7BB5
MTLAVTAHRLPGVRVEIFHAISPAVPPEATARVHAHATLEGWTLHIIDAEEFSDDAYLNNPVNRCFHCKNHLYGTIAPRTDAVIVSGTNTDDLDDFRPGLKAAQRYGVRHPYVDAGFDKRAVRSLARALELTDLAELPSAPCLSSRIETGLAIQPHVLALVHDVERELTQRLAPQVVRCRVRAGRIVVELDESTLHSLAPAQREDVRAWTVDRWRADGHDYPVELRPYLPGSAFLRGPDRIGPFDPTASD